MRRGEGDFLILVNPYNILRISVTYSKLYYWLLPCTVLNVYILCWKCLKVFEHNSLIAMCYTCVDCLCSSVSLSLTREIQFLTNETKQQHTTNAHTYSRQCLAHFERCFIHLVVSQQFTIDVYFWFLSLSLSPSCFFYPIRAYRKNQNLLANQIERRYQRELDISSRLFFLSNSNLSLLVWLLSSFQLFDGNLNLSTSQHFCNMEAVKYAKRFLHSSLVTTKKSYANREDTEPKDLSPDFFVQIFIEISTNFVKSLEMWLHFIVKLRQNVAFLLCANVEMINDTCLWFEPKHFTLYLPVQLSKLWK